MNDKKQLLINHALNLFYHHGINSVGINEVLKSSGIAKKTLYHHFASKDELILATLKQRDINYCMWLELKIKNTTNDHELIEGLFDGLTSWFQSDESLLGDFRGCFFINTSAEFSDNLGEISQYCQQHKMKVKALIKQYLINKSDSLLDTICLLKEGAITSAFVNQDMLSAQKCKLPLIKLLDQAY